MTEIATVALLKARIAELEHEVAKRGKRIEELVPRLADLVGHARWVAGTFDIHYAHLGEAEAALGAHP